MPRPARRLVAHPRDEVTTTPTRPTATNSITAAIPPFMLETPPHAPFITTPVPPSNNPGQSIVPEPSAHRNRNARGQQHQTPTANASMATQMREQSSQVSSNALGSTMSEGGPHDEHSYLESVHHDAEDAKQLRGLRDISSLATWSLSSAKPGCALAQLRHPSPTYFWQSDGPQPHTLTLHFFKLVAIVRMRVYLDFELDESYTPTKMKFFAGMSEGGLVEFASWEVTETVDPVTQETHSSIENIRGWIDVPLKGVGGRETRYHEISRTADFDADDAINFQSKAQRVRTGIKSISSESHSQETNEPMDDFVGGDILKAMVVQVRICENHQNGKDTHVRGFQVFAKDETGMKEIRKVVKKAKNPVSNNIEGEEILGLQPAEWMADPEIR